MERQPVESSSLRSVGYDAGRQELEIEFHDGTIYLYGNVPEPVYAALLRAESKGGYFNAEIREQYVYHKVAGREDAGREADMVQHDPDRQRSDSELPLQDKEDSESDD